MQSHSDLAGLKTALANIDWISDDDWKQTLSQRKVAELQFHDANRDRQHTPQDKDTYERFYGNKKYLSLTAFCPFLPMASASTG